MSHVVQCCLLSGQEQCLRTLACLLINLILFMHSLTFTCCVVDPATPDANLESVPTRTPYYPLGEMQFCFIRRSFIHLLSNLCWKTYFFIGICLIVRSFLFLRFIMENNASFCRTISLF